jgi:hypothetical protein
MNEPGPQLSLTPKEDEPGIVAAPFRAAAIRPEAFQGFFMRYANWDRLKRLVRRVDTGDPINWKDVAILFYGTALGSLPSILTQHDPLQWTPITVIATGAIILGVVCNAAHWSVRRREHGSLETIMETMDEVEAEFTRH